MLCNSVPALRGSEEWQSPASEVQRVSQSDETEEKQQEKQFIKKLWRKN